MTLEAGAPDAWQYEIVTSIHQKVTKSELSNYVPVNLTSVFSKVIERWVRGAMLQFMLANDCTVDVKHGFVRRQFLIRSLLFGEYPVGAVFPSPPPC